MKKIMEVIADKGSIVINGVCFSNGLGDGSFDIIFMPEKPKSITECAWIDLRSFPIIEIWMSDCNVKNIKRFDKNDFDNADAISFGIAANGNMIIWKLF